MVLGKGAVKAGHGRISGHFGNLFRRIIAFPQQFTCSAHFKRADQLTITFPGIVLHDPPDLAGTVVELLCHLVAGSIGEVILNKAENS